MLQSRLLGIAQEAPATILGMSSAVMKKVPATQREKVPAWIFYNAGQECSDIRGGYGGSWIGEYFKHILDDCTSHGRGTPTAPRPAAQTTLQPVTHPTPQPISKPTKKPTPTTTPQPMPRTTSKLEPVPGDKSKKRPTPTTTPQPIPRTTSKLEPVPGDKSKKRPQPTTQPIPKQSR